MKRFVQLAAIGFILLPGQAFAQWVACVSTSETCTTANVGIGHTNPTQVLHVFKNHNANTVMTIQNLDVSGNAAGVFRAQSDTAFGSLFAHSSVRTISRYGQTLAGYVELSATTGTGLIVGTLPSVPLILGTAGAERMRIDSTGRVGIGTLNPTVALEVVGAFKATSVVGAVYQDFAEWVPASFDLKPGTVVTLNMDRNNEVTPSTKPYDTAVAGVVSAQPGILLGEGSSSKEMIATTGRVKVHVTTANGAIKVGDLLVTSDKPGVAMKSLPLDLGGTQIHRPGTLVGKALEPLASGDGEILVLLSLQ